MLPIKMSSLQKDPVMMSLFAISVNKNAHTAPTESECRGTNRSGNKLEVVDIATQEENWQNGNIQSKDIRYQTINI